MNIQSIARKAKVSTATVSRVLNGITTVDPQLAKRVWKVAEEVGYYPNVLARGLVSGRSRTFGLVVSEITNPFFPEIIQSFEEMAVEHNYEILVTSIIHGETRTESAVKRMIERRVDGVAMLTFGMEDTLIEHLRFRKVPLVFVDVGPDLPGVSNIRINYQNGIRQAVQHLAALKHTRIGFIAGPLSRPSAVARRESFRIAMEEISLVPDILIEGDHTVGGGMRALSELMAMPSRPTAVICSNDMTAIGVMRQAYDTGLKIPHDLSLVGFDDIRLAQFVTPPLTTVRMSQVELGRIAFKALMTAVEAENPASGRIEYELDTNLILRSTTMLAEDFRKAPQMVVGPSRNA